MTFFDLSLLAGPNCRGQDARVTRDNLNGALASEISALGSFELRTETIKALKASQQDLFVAQALLRPPFQSLIDAKSFHAMKFAVFQIGVVNYFGQAKHGSFTNPKEFDQRFESAAISIMAEF